MTQNAMNSYIDPKAKIADSVVIGPNSYIGPEVTIGPGCKLYNNVTIFGPTTIDSENIFFPNTVIGADPQDLKYKGGRTTLSIGSNNIFRENVTVNRGTELGGAVTTIGNGNLFMAGVHIAHDCFVEDHVVVANCAMIAGHVKLERSVVIGGGAGIHHFVTIGRNAMIGGLTRVVSDVPPFMIFEGNPGAIRGVNVKGLQRNGISDSEVEAIKNAYKKLFRGGNFLAALEELDHANGDQQHVKYLLDFTRNSFQGKFGRFLETRRKDSAGDLGTFYQDKK